MHCLLLHNHNHGARLIHSGHECSCKVGLGQSSIACSSFRVSCSVLCCNIHAGAGSNWQLQAQVLHEFRAHKERLRLCLANEDRQASWGTKGPIPFCVLHA